MSIVSFIHRKQGLFALFLVLALFMMTALAGCKGDDGATGPTSQDGATGPAGKDGLNGTNVSCLSANCHGNSELVKTIQVDATTTESVPLYVDGTQFATTVHGALECVNCHTDIDPSGLHGPVNKTYGGWSRFSKSQAVESIGAGAELKTRNYYSTAVANSCATCHTQYSNFKNSAHATIFKNRAAHIDAELTTIASSTLGENTPYVIGEDYAVGNCNRCHAACQTCHFKSVITAKNADSVDNYWDEIQATDKYTPVSSGTPTSVPDSMSEYQMDWTKNVAKHEFRTKAYFATDSEGVCKACHVGFNRPAKNAYYWTDKLNGLWAKVKAVFVKRHPQAMELAISGSTTLSPLTGGTNTAHSAMTCAGCHGTASGKTGNVHNLPGVEYDWRTQGDIQCVDCHGTYVHINSSVAMHLDAAGTKVACIGCHTFGLARNFELASSGTSSSHDVFIDPVTQEVRPVVYKNGHAIAWYSHNWQTLNPGSGRTDPAGDCAKKCHYNGNLVGAGF